MEDKAFQIRIKSFGYSLLSFAVVGVLGFFVSPEFQNLVTEHFGNTAVTTIVLLIVPEIVKAIRNQWQLGKLGGDEDVTLI